MAVHSGAPIDVGPPVRQAGRRRSTISGESPSDKLPRRLPGISDPTAIVHGGRSVPQDRAVLPDKESFMKSAEWLWGVLERTDRFLLG